MTTVSHLTEVLTQVVEAIGLELDEVTLSKAGKYRVLEISLDGDEIDLDKVADASRAISAYLDETDVMGEQQYTLEVATRGIDKPLIKPAHWQRNVGRLVKVTGDAINETGRIKEFINPNVILEINGKERTVDISSVSKALVQVEFKKLSDGE